MDSKERQKLFVPFLTEVGVEVDDDNFLNYVQWRWAYKTGEDDEMIIFWCLII